MTVRTHVINWLVNVAFGGAVVAVGVMIYVGKGGELLESACIIAYCAAVIIAVVSALRCIKAAFIDHCFRSALRRLMICLIAAGSAIVVLATYMTFIAHKYG